MALVKPRTTTVPIYQGDDLERLAELRMVVAQAEREYEQAQKRAESAEGAPRRTGDAIPSVGEAEAALDAARADYNAAVDEAEPRAVIVRLTALGNARWAELLKAHPPRKDNDADEAYGVDTDAFPTALLTFRDGRSTVTVDGATDAEVDEFLAVIAGGDLERLWTTAYWLNRSPGGDPKATRFSDGSQMSDEN